MPQYSAEYIKEKLQKELDAVHVYFKCVPSDWECVPPDFSNIMRVNVKISIEDVSDGCGAKFIAVIVSPKFDGHPLLERHRMVNSILEEEMKIIHAFSQKTLTPEQWEKQKS